MWAKCDTTFALASRRQPQPQPTRAHAQVMTRAELPRATQQPQQAPPHSGDLFGENKCDEQFEMPAFPTVRSIKR